jgi:hypothetical protein
MTERKRSGDRSREKRHSKSTHRPNNDKTGERRTTNRGTGVETSETEQGDWSVSNSDSPLALPSKNRGLPPQQPRRLSAAGLDRLSSLMSQGSARSLSSRHSLNTSGHSAGSRNMNVRNSSGISWNAPLPGLPAFSPYAQSPRGMNHAPQGRGISPMYLRTPVAQQRGFQTGADGLMPLPRLSSHNSQRRQSFSSENSSRSPSPQQFSGRGWMGGPGRMSDSMQASNGFLPGWQQSPNTSGRGMPYNNGTGRGMPYNSAPGRGMPYNNGAGRGMPNSNGPGRGMPYNNGPGRQMPYHGAGRQGQFGGRFMGGRGFPPGRGNWQSYGSAGRSPMGGRIPFGGRGPGQWQPQPGRMLPMPPYAGGRGFRRSLPPNMGGRRPGPFPGRRHSVTGPIGSNNSWHGPMGPGRPMPNPRRSFQGPTGAGNAGAGQTTSGPPQGYAFGHGSLHSVGYR